MEQITPNAPGSGAPRADAGEPAREKKRRGAAFWIAVVVAIAALAAACTCAYIWWQGQQGSSRDANALIGQIEGKSQEEVQAELDRIVEEGMFNISIASTVDFEDGASEGAIKIENVPGNRYLMQVDIVRDDTDEIIYQSGILEPNYHIQSARLDAELPAGTYACTAIFHALDPASEEEIGQAAANMTIRVLS